jgi:subtilisin family serine protease/photosystem II stability/assembly factor-like uncharacterized protein
MHYSELFMFTFRTIVTGSIFVILSAAFSVSKPIESIKDSPFNKSNNIAYNIFISGKKVSGGWTPAKIISIPRVGKEHYLPNAIHLKTKTLTAFDKSTSTILSSVLLTDLGKLNIHSIRAPFGFTGDKMLAVDEFGTDRILEITYQSDIDPYDICSQLINNPEVEYAVPVFIYQTCDYSPNDPRLANQWHINNIQLTKAWDLSKGSDKVIIGIVDSGTDWMHEDLAGNIWINPGEIANNGVDDDKNGKIDDIRGWDLVGNINANQIGMSQFMEDNDPKNPGSGSTNTHGTHVAGCASASTDNGKGVSSPGFNCKLMPVKCATDQNGIIGIYRGYEGITYAANNGAHIINCSWGGPGYSPVGQDVINAATAKGALVVVAAGNDGMNIDNGEFYPACFDNVMCVGSNTSNNRNSSFSNTGATVTVYSPGSSILATMPNNSYQNSDGTSMASPVAAGVAALLKSQHPEWSPKQILHQIRSTSENVVTTVPAQRPYYYGRINAFRALDYNRNGGPNIPGLEITDIIMTSGDAISDYDPLVIRLEVSNFLANAGNVIMKIQPLNNFISINTQSINLGNIAQGQKKNVDLALQLLKTTPWFEGTANIIVSFESATYTDYQLVKLPVKFSSKNLYTQIGTLPEYYVPQWSGAVCPKPGVIWMAGYGGMFGANGGYYRIFGSTPSGKPISSEYFFCIDALDENKAFAGSARTTNTSATFHKTINGGNTWTSVSLSTITRFTNSIKFYDESTGIVLGDQLNGKFGIARTIDGGANWTQPSAIPAPQANEDGLVGCASYMNSSIWFGTNQGRVIRSSDRGNSWEATQITGAGQIHNLSFINETNGLAVYSEAGKTEKLIASTTNAGNTWLTNRYNLTTNKLTPIYFYANPNAGRIYMLCSGGQVFSTKSNGQVWDAVLTLYHGNAMIGAACDVPISKMRIWDIGESFGYLDFSYMPANIVKTLEMTTTNTIQFDTVEISSFKLRTVTIKNSGNVPITIYPEITPDAGVQDDEYKLFGFSSGEIQPGTELNLRVKFSPKGLGARTAKLKITSDAEPAEFNVELVGTGSPEVAVNDTPQADESITITPNPSSDFIEVTLSDDIIEEIQAPYIRIYDLLGMEVINSTLTYSISQKGDGVMLDITGLLPGVYFVKISGIVSKFVKM